MNLVMAKMGAFSAACSLSLVFLLGAGSSTAKAEDPDMHNLLHGPLNLSAECVRYRLLRPEAPIPPECSDEIIEEPGLSDEVLDQLIELYRAMLPFHSFDVAQAAGWNVPLSECVESPAGGMGYHYANIDQLGNGGHLSLLRPEVLLYVPMEDGSMKFVGVEYIIPEPDWPHEHPPMFMGQHLHYNPMQEIWALHVWISSYNPNGIFDDWNPEVNCDFAP